MKEPKIVTTDNRELWYVRACWQEKQHPYKLLGQALGCTSLRRLGENLRVLFDTGSTKFSGCSRFT